MRFDGDETKEILPKLAPVTAGINQRRSYLSSFKDIPVLVKPNKKPKIQVLIDQLKLYFGLIPMGVSYSDRLLFIRLSDAVGYLRDAKGWQSNPSLIKEMTDIHAFRFLVRNHDLTLSNVLLLKNGHLHTGPRPTEAR